MTPTRKVSSWSELRSLLRVKVPVLQDWVVSPLTLGKGKISFQTFLLIVGIPFLITPIGGVEDVGVQEVDGGGRPSKNNYQNAKLSKNAKRGKGA